MVDSPRFISGTNRISLVKIKRNDNQKWTIQRHSQHWAQDTERGPTKKKNKKNKQIEKNRILKSNVSCVLVSINYTPVGNCY